MKWSTIQCCEEEKKNRKNFVCFIRIHSCVTSSSKWICVSIINFGLNIFICEVGAKEKIIIIY